MIFPALIAAAVAAAVPEASNSQYLSAVARAIEAGRLDQARLMIGRAVASGAAGEQVERLMADLAYVSGKHDEALARYEQLLSKNPDDHMLAQSAGIAALKLGFVERALAHITRATEASNSSWRAWNARGVVADLHSDWVAADAAYARAEQLAPGRPEVANNRGWSQLMRGNWADAVGYFEEAAALQPASPRIANNLELARAALAQDLPARRPGESGRDWAVRLNDAGVAAQLNGNRAKAIAAFTQALEASEAWYWRAANNLAAVTTGE